MATVESEVLQLIYDCIDLEVDSKTASYLYDIRKQFETLQDSLHAVELMTVKYKMSEWIASVERLFSEFKIVMAAYNLYLLHEVCTAASPVTRLVQCFLGNNAFTVSGKIQEFLSKYDRRRIENFRSVNSSKIMANFMSIRMKSVISVRKFVQRLKSPTPKLMAMCLEMSLEKAGSLIDEARHYRIEPDAAANHVSDGTQTLIERRRMVGRESEVAELMDLLLKETQDFAVVGVFGERGIGKTTVATAVYNKAKLHFDCYARVSVSQNSEASILRDTFTSFLESLSMIAPSNLESVDIGSLKGKIHLLLEMKNFLLVLDDLSDFEKWDCIESALPGSCRGKLLLTSTPHSIIPSNRSFTPIYLNKLSSDFDMQLLQKHAPLPESGKLEFWGPSVLVITKDILHKCEGIPLAISMIGGMLSTKKKAEEWTAVRRRLRSQFAGKYANSDDRIRLITTCVIQSCFADLRPVLKSCLLHISLFPPQYEISCKRLIRLWIAEGFGGNKYDWRKLENTARQQLNELIQRNLLQIGQVGEGGEIKTCKTFQLVQEFILQRYGFKMLSKNMNMEEYASSSISYRSLLYGIDRSRTLHFTGGRKEQVERIVKSKCRFRLLHQLELQNVPLENLPSAVGDLVLLRYFGLRATKLKTLPAEALMNLWNLQTLDVRDTLVRDVPMIKWHGKLRHLLLAGSFDDRVVDIDVNIGNLQNLQTLAGVKLTETTAKGLRYLNHLQKLSVGMKKKNTVSARYLLESIRNMGSLKSLTVKCHIIEISPLYLPSRLVTLKIGGRVINWLPSIQELTNLKYLYMWDCAMVEDPISSLQRLPNLVVLSLCNAYLGEKVVFGKSNCFQNLKKLSILHSKNLNDCGAIEKGTLNKLEILKIGYCPRLETPPDGLENLTSLKEVQLTNIPDSFLQVLKDFHSKQDAIKFTLRVPTSKPPQAIVTFPPSLPPYDFNRIEAGSKNQDQC